MNKFRREQLGGAWIALILVAASCINCGGSQTAARKAADGFMRSYYVNADLTRASQFADSLALEKLTTEKSLRAGLTVDAAAHHPKIHFELTETRAAHDQTVFLYNIDFHPKMGQAVHKKVRLMVRLRDDGTWKVTQFSDYEPL